MVRPKGSKNVKQTLKKEVEKKQCTSCKKMKHPANDYYMTNSKYHADQRHPVCKVCLRKDVSVENIDSIKRFLLELNRPWIANLWHSTLIEAENKNSDPIGLYIKNCQISYKELTWLDSDAEINDNDSISFSTKKDDEQVVTKIESSIDDKKNQEDVLRMLGYDPFEFETPNDRRHLFNKLIDFLDESTLEDSFKLPAVIEIVKSFNQIDKINSALSHITSDAKSVASNVGGITSLVNAKEKMLKSVLALAKDNGISVNHNNNKSKGGNTLNGIVKKLNEIGLDAAEVNLFDLETCDAMKQIADFSNRSILDQLMLDENDYTDMIAEQKQMIQKLDDKLIKLEEENRILKIKIKQFEQQ